jgi:hypothetical protein
MQIKDPELSPSGSWCEASRVPFRREGHIVDVAVASVERGYVMSIDVVIPIMDSIVRLPDDRLVNLGHVAPVPLQDGAPLGSIMKGLEIDAGTSDASVLKKFYEPALELTKRGYCVVYEMKPPFTGSMSQCAGSGAFFGGATYMPGATTWKQARAMACDLVQGPTDRCEIFEQRLFTDENANAVYLIQVLHYLPDGSKYKYERLYFFIDVMTGRATLRGRSFPNEPRLRPAELLKTS